jgi:hypothetical protein
VRLITAHRILIACGIGFFALYALLQLRQWYLSGSVAAALQSVVAALVAVGFQRYYRTLARWGKR